MSLLVFVLISIYVVGALRELITYGFNTVENSLCDIYPPLVVAKRNQFQLLIHSFIHPFQHPQTLHPHPFLGPSPSPPPSSSSSSPPPPSAVSFSPSFSRPASLARSRSRLPRAPAFSFSHCSL